MPTCRYRSTISPVTQHSRTRPSSIRQRSGLHRLIRCPVGARPRNPSPEWVAVPDGQPAKATRSWSPKCTSWSRRRVFCDSPPRNCLKIRLAIPACPRAAPRVPSDGTGRHCRARSRQGNVPVSLLCPAEDRAAAFTYGAAGSVAQDIRTCGTCDYAYDAAGRMKEVNRNGVVEAEYLYNAAGQQVIRKLSAAGHDIHVIHDQWDEARQKGRPVGGPPAPKARRVPDRPVHQHRGAPARVYLAGGHGPRRGGGRGGLLRPDRPYRAARPCDGCVRYQGLGGQLPALRRGPHVHRL